jgi:hypothetical protein
MSDERVIYVRWSDDGQHIRKWDTKPFDGGEPMYSRSFLLSEERVEAVARAIYRQSNLDPDTLYEHHEWEKWPVDERREYVDAISGEPRVSLMHRGWRKRTAHARAALSAAMGDGNA